MSKKSGSSAGLITRRSVLLAPVVLATAQPPGPDVLVVWTTLRTLPESISRECMVFPRAYAASPKPELNRRAIEAGKFPHAIVPGNPTLPLRQLTARDAADVASMALSPPPNVIVVITSFAGDGRDSPLESSIRVPLAIRFPGILTARAAPEILISHVDLMPTILGLAGVPVPASVQGRNLAPLLTRRQGSVPDSIYVQGSDWRVVIRGFDKLVFNVDEEVTALYNLADDPEETNDLAREPSQQLTRDAMLALARVWMRRLNDGWDSSGAKLRR